MLDATVKRALASYGIKPPANLPVQSGYRSEVYTVSHNLQKLNLIFYKAEPNILASIKNANRLSNYLAENDLPTRQTVDQRMLKVSGPNGDRYASLYNYLPGSTIAWEGYTSDHIKLVGWALAELHAQAAKLSQADAPSITYRSTKLTQSMRAYFSDDGVKTAMAAKLKLKLPNGVFDWLDKVAGYTDSQPQLLHLDFVRGNLLFDQASPNYKYCQGKVSLSGIIDFEKVSFGSRLHDIARTLAFLLVDCKYKPAEKIRKYFLQSGYQKRGGGQIKDTKALEKLVIFYLFHDFYKFLRHNPYQDLPQNEHFVRTLDRLLQTGVVQAL